MEEQEQSLQCNICYLPYSESVVPMIVCKNSHFTCKGCIDKIRVLKYMHYQCPFCKQTTHSDFPFKFKKIFALGKISKSTENKIKGLQRQVENLGKQLVNYSNQLIQKQSEIEKLQCLYKECLEKYMNDTVKLSVEVEEFSQSLSKEKKRGQLIFLKNLELQNLNAKLKNQIANICQKYQQNYLKNQANEKQLEAQYKKKLQRQKQANTELSNQNERLLAQIKRLKIQTKKHKCDQQNEDMKVQIQSIIDPQRQQLGSHKNVQEKKTKIKKVKDFKTSKEQILRKTQNIFRQHFKQNDQL